MVFTPFFRDYEHYIIIPHFKKFLEGKAWVTSPGVSDKNVIPVNPLKNNKVLVTKKFNRDYARPVFRIPEFLDLFFFWSLISITTVTQGFKKGFHIPEWKAWAWAICSLSPYFIRPFITWCSLRFSLAGISWLLQERLNHNWSHTAALLYSGI